MKSKTFMKYVEGELKKANIKLNLVNKDAVIVEPNTRVSGFFCFSAV